MSKPVEPFAYSNYRSFVRDFVDAKLADNPRLSYRYFAKKAGFGSPTYFQQVIREQRNLTVDTARKVASAFELTGMARKYLIALVELDLAADANAKAAITGQMKRLALLQRRSKVSDPDIHSHWLHAVIYELATAKDFVLTPETALEKLRGAVSRREVEESLAFLTSRKYLVPTREAGRYKQEPFYLSPFNDVKMLNLQQCHLKFLDLAKDRISDEPEQREFQNLTMAISSKRLTAVKARLRAFVDDLRQDLANDSEADTVVHLECCLFKVTD